MKKKQYVLRNGIVVEPTGELEFQNVRVISIPKGFSDDPGDGDGPWKKGQKRTLILSMSDDPAVVLDWTGGAYGKGYDVVRELEGG
jgi:hypothetical protein